MQSLRILSLEEGVIEGSIPSEFSQLSDLEVLDLNFNLIGGTLPDSLYSLTRLQQLDLNANSLEGTISTLIGQLRDLDFFQIQTNNIVGTIPTEFGLLSLLGKYKSICVIMLQCACVAYILPNLQVSQHLRKITYRALFLHRFVAYVMLN